MKAVSISICLIKTAFAHFHVDNVDYSRIYVHA